MKVLLDENLSPRLIEAIADLYSGSQHVHNCGLATSADDEIWEYARAENFTITSKDSDFAERSVLRGSPPKVIWLRGGNCSTEEVLKLLRSANELIRSFIETDLETCLILGRKEVS